MMIKDRQSEMTFALHELRWAYKQMLGAISKREVHQSITDMDQAMGRVHSVGYSLIYPDKPVLTIEEALKEFDLVY